MFHQHIYAEIDNKKRAYDIKERATERDTEQERKG